MYPGWGDGPADTALAPRPGGPGPQVLSALRIGTVRIAKLKTVLGGAVCNLGHASGWPKSTAGSAGPDCAPTRRFTFIGGRAVAVVPFFCAPRRSSSA
jgi:hypothetical protein